MKVKRFKQLVAALPSQLDNVDVLVQGDSEGNSYDTLYGVDHKSLVVHHGHREFDIYDSEWDADDAGMTEEEWEDFKKDAKRVVILFP